MRSRLYNFGDSWAWGYNDNFETPYKTTYAGIIAKNFGLQKVDACLPGWGMGNVGESFLNHYPDMNSNDYVLVTIPPDTRLAIARANGRMTQTVFSHEKLWETLVEAIGGNPYHFELSIIKECMMIAGLCRTKGIKYAFQHNYATMYFNDKWDLSIIKENYCYPEQSMMDLLGIDNDWYAGSSLEEQVQWSMDGPNFNDHDKLLPPNQNETKDIVLNRSIHPTPEGAVVLANKLTHRLREIWDTQPTSGINSVN